MNTSQKEGQHVSPCNMSILHIRRVGNKFEILELTHRDAPSTFFVRPNFTHGAYYLAESEKGRQIALEYHRLACAAAAKHLHNNGFPFATYDEGNDEQGIDYGVKLGGIPEGNSDLECSSEGAFVEAEENISSDDIDRILAILDARF